MKRNRILLSALVAIQASAAIAAPQQSSVDPRANETKAQRDARMKWWREARFGMFIHWGLYSVPAGFYDGKPIGGIGEWIMRTANIPVARYAEYAKQFDPEKFNAEEWASYAKAAGMKYIVMTAKHHEGFAMYPTKVDDYNINAKTKFKRDPIGEMAAACKKAGIRFGVYYSQNLDWHHAGGGTAGAPWDDAQKGSFDEYVRKVSAPHVDELLTRYKPAVLWWDINGPFTPEQVKLLTAPFAKDPKIISNNRLGGGVPGDTETPEQFIPATGFKGRDWETCMTINDTWGYKSNDFNFKSTATLLRNLIDIASKGGNYLLNVGPTSEGVIPAQEVQRLKEMGEWMKGNGASIYKTTASPFKRLPFDGRATVHGRTLYLNVFNWAGGNVRLTGLQNKVLSVKALATGQSLSFTKSPTGEITIYKPTKVDSVSTAVALTLDGPPVVNEPEVFWAPSSNGEYTLSSAIAELDGDTIRVEGSDQANLGYWTNAHDAAHWNLFVPPTAARAYKVTLEYACQPGAEGSTYVITVNGKRTGVGGTVEKTGGWGDYKEITLDGTLTLAEGKQTLRISATSMPRGAVMNLRSISLVPVK